MSNDPFDDNKEHKFSSNLKLNPSKSRFTSKINEKKESADNLKETVAEFQEEDKKIAKEIIELSKRFTGFIKNKIVSENKSPIEADLEQETIKRLTNLSLQLNNDDRQPEGIGSVGCIMLLFKTVLAQRDIINNLEYRIVQLERKKSSEDK